MFSFPNDPFNIVSFSRHASPRYLSILLRTAVQKVLLFPIWYLFALLQNQGRRLSRTNVQALMLMFFCQLSKRSSGSRLTELTVAISRGVIRSNLRTR